MKISIGNLIDQLTVANTRIWMAEDIKRKPDATDKEIADATRITNVVNQQRNDLIQAIDESLNHMVQNGEIQKIYKQGTTKIYGKK
jgi:ABC-type amino acid transport substrate-binding protein